MKSCIVTSLTRLSKFQRNNLLSLLSLCKEIYLETTLSQQNASVSFCMNTKICYTSSELLFLKLSLFLLVRPSDFIAGSIPITMRPGSVSYLLDPAKLCWVLCYRFVLVYYLFIYLVRNFFFQNATSLTYMSGYCT